MKQRLLAILIMVVLLPLSSEAASLGLLRKWVVFPFDTEQGLKSSAERAWWKCRELLTEKKKYLVASRQFLTEKDVLQPRKTLNSADIKLLGNLLEADVLVTGFMERKQFVLSAYLVSTGSTLWTKHMAFHPSLKPEDQLEFTSERLTREMIAHIPYQAFTILDPLINKIVYEEGGKQFALIDVGTTDNLSPGAEIQWVEIKVPDEIKSNSNIFSETNDIVIAEGRVTQVKRGVAVVEVLKSKDKNSIQEKGLVRIPEEAERLAKTFLPDDVSTERLAPELVPDNIAPVVVKSKGEHRAGVFVGSLLSILGIIALAL